ncbi:integumentary mucin C.1-like [Haliotis rubra]|uniref:integumentary mucin C.1-like n=1 Tax=Haliotis rubra TaxID=36100 RepID=UPI001EE5CB36|nr:integumentary mucin C.1-like [Haliotis rubra]
MESILLTKEEYFNLIEEVNVALGAEKKTFRQYYVLGKYEIVQCGDQGYARCNCSTKISAQGILFNAFYGPSRPPDLTLSSTPTTSTPASSSTPQYPTPTFGPQISSDDHVVSTIYVTTSTPKTTTTYKTTPLTYLYPNTSISTVTITAMLSQSANPTDFDQPLHTSLGPDRNSTRNSTSVWLTTSSTARVVENASKTNQQYYNEDKLDTLGEANIMMFTIGNDNTGGLIAGSVVAVIILLLACIAVCIFVGHRRNEVRPEDDDGSVYVNHYVTAPPIVYKL